MSMRVTTIFHIPLMSHLHYQALMNLLSHNQEQALEDNDDKQVI